MLTTGVDIIEISRVGRVLADYGPRFLRRIYTVGEIDYCRGRSPNSRVNVIRSPAPLAVRNTSTSTS